MNRRTLKYKWFSEDLKKIKNAFQIQALRTSDSEALLSAHTIAAEKIQKILKANVNKLRKLYKKVADPFVKKWYRYLTSEASKFNEWFLNEINSLNLSSESSLQEFKQAYSKIAFRVYSEFEHKCPIQDARTLLVQKLNKKFVKDFNTLTKALDFVVLNLFKKHFKKYYSNDSLFWEAVAE